MHVEAAPNTEPGVPDYPYFVTINHDDINIRRHPNTDLGGRRTGGGPTAPTCVMPCWARLKIRVPRTRAQTPLPPGRGATARNRARIDIAGAGTDSR